MLSFTDAYLSQTLFLRQPIRADNNFGNIILPEPYRGFPRGATSTDLRIGAL